MEGSGGEKFFKIKCEREGDYEFLKDRLSVNGIQWGQKAIGKPLQVWSLWNEEYLRRFLDEAPVPYVLKQKDFREFHKKDFYHFYASNGRDLMQEDFER